MASLTNFSWFKGSLIKLAPFTSIKSASSSKSLNLNLAFIGQYSSAMCASLSSSLSQIILKDGD